jgi:hypothetical protein
VVPKLVPMTNDSLELMRDSGKLLILNCAPVAQLDRAFDYESKGRKFESCRAHCIINNLRAFPTAVKAINPPWYQSWYQLFVRFPSLRCALPRLLEGAAWPRISDQTSHNTPR